MNLYEITKEYADTLNNLEIDENGEILDFAEFEKTEGDFETKAEAVALYIKNLNADATAIKAEEKSLAERRKSAEGKAENLSKYLASCMLAVERDVIETPKCKLSFRKSTSVQINNEALIPKAFIITKTTETPDKNGIKEAIKSGIKVEGVSLVENKNLQIK